jgi:hypothetical protein
MNRAFLAQIHDLIPFPLIALFFSAVGCGAVGPPIAPEDVGIEAKIQKQRKDQAQKEGLPPEDELISPVDEPVELPAFYPIGTR